MKKLFSKDNKLSKIVALWLVFIMMLTPLVSHIGDKKGAKAATVDTSAAFEPELTLDMSGKNYTIAQKSEGIYYIQPQYNPMDNMETFYFGGGNVIFNAPTATGTPSSITLAGIEQSGISYTDVKLMLADSSDGLPLNPKEEGDVSSSVTVSDNSTKYVGVYVKAAGDLADNDGNLIATTGYVYSLLKVYKLEYKDFASDSQLKGWYDVDVNSLKDKWVSNTSQVYAYVGQNAYDFNTKGDKYLGNVKIMMAEEVDGQDAIDYITTATILENPSIDTNRSSLYKQYAPSATGNYVAIAAYCNGDTVVAAKELGTLQVDKDDPTGTLKVQSSDDGGKTWTDVGTNGTVDTDGSCLVNTTFDKDYRLVLFVEDAISGVNTDDRFDFGEYNSSISGWKPYYFDITDKNCWKEYKVTINDKAGNTAEIKYTVNAFGADNGNGITVKDIYVINADGTKTTGDYVGKIGGIHVELETAVEPENISIKMQGGNTRSADPKPEYTFNEATQKYTVSADIFDLFIFNKREFEKCDITVSNDNDTNRVQSETKNNVGFTKKTYDGINPSVNSVVLQMSDPGEDVWDDLADSTSTESVGIGVGADYRFNFTIEETTSAVASVVLYTDSECTPGNEFGDKATYIEDADLEEDNKYQYVFDIVAADLPAVPTTYYVKVTDISGNYSIYRSMPSVYGTGEISLVATLVDNNNETTVLDPDVNIVNSEYASLKIVASSNFELVSLVLEDENGVIESTTDTKTNQYNNNIQEIVYEFNENVDLSDVVITATYKKGNDEVKTEIFSCAQLLYDETNPVIGSKADDGYNELSLPQGWYNGKVYTGWVNKFDLTISYASGEDESKPESLLAKAIYTIDNAKAGNGSHDIISEDGIASTTCQQEISVPEANSLQGTKITVDAMDVAGNSFTGKAEYNFKVDATAPTTVTLSVDGVDSDDSIIRIDDSKKVYAYVKDNLTIGRIDFVITTPDGTEKVVSYTYDTEKWREEYERKKEVSLKTLFDDAKLDIVDGVYTLSVIGYDKAGNSTALAADDVVTFIVDNTDPKLQVEPDDTITGVGLFYSKDGENWSRAKISEIDHTAHVNKAENKQYRYYISLIEENEKSIVCYKDNSVYGEVKYDDTKELWYLDVNLDDINKETPLALSVTATDIPGGSSTIELLPMMLEVELNITINVEVSGYTEKELMQLVYTEEACEVKVEVISGYFITSIDFFKNGEEYDSFSYKCGDEEKPTADYYSQYNETEGKYYQTVEITIPKDTNINEFLKNFEVVATDTVADFSYLIGNIFYDDTDPELTDQSGKEISIATTWLDEYTLKYWIKSGSDNEEAPIVKAYYKIDEQENVDITITDGEAKGEIVIPESEKVTGTTLYIYAEDASGNNKEFKYTIKVDETAPEVKDVTVNSAAVSTIPYVGTPVINANVTDNWAIGKVAFAVTYPDGTVKTTEFEYKESEHVYDANKGYAVTTQSHKIPTPEGMTSIPDGKYKVVVTVWDKATNVSQNKTIFLTVDNTVPVVTGKISGGVHGGKSPTKNFDGTARDYYYNAPVEIELTYVEDNLDDKTLIVTDNGTKVPDSKLSWKYDSKLGGYVTKYSVTTEGKHVIKINASDLAGHDAEEKTVEFVIDDTDPALQVVLNGALTYLESMGTLDLTSNATIAVNETDTNKDQDDFNFKLSITRPDEATVEGTYSKSDKTTFSFSEEADYVFYVYTKDMAGNQSAERQVSFRVDKTAPQLTIGGISDGGSSSNATTVSFTLTEAFWKDATGHVAIYRQAGEGTGETLLKEMDITPTAFRTTLSETLSESGIYRFEFTAEDRVGHTATTSQTFTIDKDAPVVTVEGSENYAKTKEDVKFSVEITDDFYISKKVTITGTRTDITGKVHDITFSGYSVATPVTTIEETFTEDGVYEISVVCVDIAGNETAKTLHFTIDKTKPEIGDLSAYDGTMLKEFNFDVDLDELISDLTVCDVHMYLNGSEYDGVSDIEDGAYTLLITAEDELDHYQEKEVSFTLDTKAPVFIVTGVEDGEVKNEEYVINISLQLDEDELWMVTLNGKEMSIGGDTCSINITEKGEYELVMKAKDRAGNESEQTIKFKYGSESMWWLWLIIALVGLLTVGFIFFIILKKKKEDEEEAKR